MVNPKVSVGIPSYNHEKYVSDTIESILNQTFQDFEIVITDDGSTDNTVEVIKSFSDPRIKLFVFEKNQGACKAINNCIINSKGDYFANISSDDVWEPDKLEKQVQFLDENPQIPAVFTNVKIIDEEGKPFKNKNHFYSNIFEQKNRSRSKWLNQFFYHGNCICHPSMLIKKDVYDEIGFYNELMANIPDLDMWVRLCLKYDLHILDEKLTRFRVRQDENNISGDKISTHVRINFEILHLLDHYLEINDIEFFLKVFPDAEKFGILKPNMIPYFLSRLAYETDQRHMQLWALNTLFNFMQSDTIVDELKKDYNFSYPDFLKMSAAGDFSNFQLLHDKQSAINYLQTANDEKAETIINLETISAENSEKISNLEFNLINLQDGLIKKDNYILDLKSNINIINKEMLLKDKKISKLESNINILTRSRKSDLYKNFQILFSKYLSSEPIEKKSILAQLSNIPYLFIILKSKGNLKNTWINIKGYRAIKSLGLFDEAYYLNKYKNVLISGINPLIHYLFFGWKEGKCPSAEFDGDNYLNKFPDVKNSKMNPLLHYSLYGINEKRSSNILAKNIDSKHVDLIIFDDIFPHPLSAFRFQEYNSYLEHFKNIEVYSSGDCLSTINEINPIETVIEKYEKEYPQFKGKVKKYNSDLISNTKAIYTIFLNNIYPLIDKINENHLPFVFTLYPGGGFYLNDEISDEKLKTVFSSAYFRKVIVTQRITHDYLIDNNFCKADQIEEIFGGVAPLKLFEEKNYNKKFFGKDKSVLDICFVAQRYTEEGKDKGYDVFINIAHKLAKKYNNIQFHVVGGFDESVLDVTQIKDKIHFYGLQSYDWFYEFYKDKDIILSPNLPFILKDGAFDGFPTGCCIDAGVHKVAIFCTDELNLNTNFNEKEMVIIPHDSEKIVKIIERYYKNPEKIQKIAENGYLKIKKVYSFKNQITPRIRILEEIIIDR